MIEILFPLLIIILIVVLLRTFGGKKEVLSNWSHYFDYFQFRSEDFYTQVTRHIRNRNIPNVYFDMHDRLESIANLVNKRVYLRITTSGYIFDVCAAPYGNGYFVSWWLFEDTDFIKRFLLNIPLIGRIIYKKTLFQIDTETMFRTCIHLAIQDAIKEMSEAQGYRTLTDSEKQITVLPAK